MDPVVDGLTREPAFPPPGKVTPRVARDLVGRPTFFKTLLDVAMSFLVVQLARSPTGHSAFVRQSLGLRANVACHSNCDIQTTLRSFTNLVIDRVAFVV